LSYTFVINRENKTAAFAFTIFSNNPRRFGNYKFYRINALHKCGPQDN